jgi:sulfofructose kinase
MTNKTSVDILGFGTIAVDDFLHVDRYPGPDDKQPVLKENRQFGGLAGTALAAAVRLEATCAYAGVLGPDDLSRIMRQALIEAGIDTRFLLERPAARPIHSVIIVDETRHTRNIFFNPAGVEPYPADRIDETLIQSARVLFVDQLGTPAAIRACQIARAANIPVVADLEWSDHERLDELMAVVDHLIAPRDFGKALTGQTNPAKILAELHGNSARSCTAITWGREGCFYLIGNDTKTIHHHPAFEVTPIETTGCGDVFHGVYAAVLARGQGVHSAVTTASAAAAVYAARPSGWQFLPTANDVQAMMGRISEP